ncbi:MAG: IS66 family transposase [archaeon]
MKLQLKSLKEKLKEKSRDEIIEEMFELLKEKEKLEKELKKYKNANTPSSANKHLKEDTQGLKAKKGAKHGAPKGHKGSTFVWPNVNEIIDLIAKKCAQCESTNIEPTGYVKKKKVVCFIKPKILIKEYHQHEFRCLDCHTLTLASHKNIPEKGIYDRTIQSLVNYLKFKARLPHNIVVDVMNNIFNVPMTGPTSLEITRRASNKLEPLYQELENNIKQAEIVGTDETSLSINGINHWIWVFCNELISLFKINKERGGDIVEKTLGKNFQGKLVSDGWQTYAAYTKENKIIHQRCWSHLNTETKFECKKKHPDIYKWCYDIYLIVQKGKNYKQEKRRQDMHKKCKNELARLIGTMKAHTNLRKLANKIENAGDKWFTCILHPELPMDNNEAERSIRPFVIIRKIIGCLRSDLGMKNYEIMMSLISTWQKQGKNTYHTLQTTL